jgi:hypothetical protein
LWLVIAPSWSECFWMFQGWRIHCGWLNPHLLKVQYPIYIPGRFLDWKANDLFLKNLFFLKKDWKKTNNLEGYQVRMIRTRSGFWLVFFWLALDSHAKDQILYSDPVSRASWTLARPKRRHRRTSPPSPGAWRRRRGRTPATWRKQLWHASVDKTCFDRLRAVI